MSQRRIPVPGTYNFRDAGGYPADGGLVREGTLFRSDGLHALGPAGRRELAQLGIRTVIDLRDDFEAQLMPDDLGDLDVDVRRLPVFEGSGASQEPGVISLPDLYRKIVTEHAAVVAEALRDIAGSGGGVLVHCTAGKDRTGVVVALALLAVGVDRELVLDDYALSEANLDGEWLDGMLAMIAEHGVEATPELRVLMGGSPREALASALDLIDETYGGVRRYLMDAGLSLSGLAELSHVLVTAHAG
ncbi:tyrosine-protein phosphatase [Microbacterium sp. STN6]|uniref:tyrosine-protein phosphatase n=1 Tax=Microbacterium sp. STN6 TaxID=2995588 RepID=UPI002260F109|nr:tyrosine-protein phosphatase [Microbacterium sp. STN6]MCX7522010.1 tyrosine-protein phosphatase [Microbacterium sp. STN6]